MNKIYCWLVEDEFGEECDWDDPYYEFETEEEALEMAGYLRAVGGNWVAQTKHIWYLGEGAERRTITVRPKTFKEDRRLLEEYRKIWGKKKGTK